MIREVFPGSILKGCVFHWTPDKQRRRRYVLHLQLMNNIKDDNNDFNKFTYLHKQRFILLLHSYIYITYLFSYYIPINDLKSI